MAEVTLTPDPTAFPIASKVRVFPRTPPEPGGILEGKPAGSEVEEPEVSTAGLLVVKGVTIGSSYIGWRSSGGKDFYLRFIAGSTFVGPEQGRPFRESHTFGIQGAVTTAVIPGFPVSLAPGQNALKLVKVRLFTTKGEVTGKLQKNGVDAAGFTGLKATTAGEEANGSVTVVENDIITFVPATVVSSPENLSVACFLEVAP